MNLHFANALTAEIKGITIWPGMLEGAKGGVLAPDAISQMADKEGVKIGLVITAKDFKIFCDQKFWPIHTGRGDKLGGFFRVGEWQWFAIWPRDTFYAQLLPVSHRFAAPWPLIGAVKARRYADLIAPAMTFLPARSIYGHAGSSSPNSQ